MDTKVEEIIKISEKLFTRSGIKAVSMDDISAAMGVSKKTLYKYVIDKHKLVRMTLESALMRQKYHERESPKGINAIEENLFVYKDVMDLISQTNFSIEYDLQKYYSDLYKKMVEARKKRRAEQLRSNLKRGISEGLYRPDIDVESLIKINILLCESMHNFDFINENRDQLVQIMKVNFDFQLRGIVNDLGLHEYLRLIKKNQNLL